MTQHWQANSLDELEKVYECKETTVYKRPKEEDTFECGHCNTVYRESWFSDNEKGWCPFCGKAVIPTQIVRLPQPKKIPGSPERAKYLKQVAIEAQIAEADYEKFIYESTPMVAGSRGDSRTPDQLRTDHITHLGKLAYANTKQTNLLLKLAEITVG